MNTIRAQTKTTTSFKDKASWYEARLSKAISRFGYSLGDVEIIEAKELNFYHGNRKGLVKRYET